MISVRISPRTGRLALTWALKTSSAISTQRRSARSTTLRTGRLTTSPAGPDLLNATVHRRIGLTPTPSSAALTA
ncbi:hypothetical protein ABZZ80_22250 [Streptomyces sp. NPDC006356]